MVRHHTSKAAPISGSEIIVEVLGLAQWRREASATSATADGLAPEGASQTKKFCLQVIKKRPRKPDVADVHEWCSAATGLACKVVQICAHDELAAGDALRPFIGLQKQRSDVFDRNPIETVNNGRKRSASPKTSDRTSAGRAVRTDQTIIGSARFHEDIRRLSELAE
ncbi:hypothetical protein EVAR_24837_1 [Eumeta japonica]|uniref:Uncharacterized protein n=1 Tax=Eumeta variegata TaxID=151549 RepID=A0A4C1YC79_EUMVA|nr:hypothetical protein EVAR_24837_1 [Eumeta japonica]